MLITLHCPVPERVASLVHGVVPTTWPIAMLMSNWFTTPSAFRSQAEMGGPVLPAVLEPAYAPIVGRLGVRLPTVSVAGVPTDVPAPIAGEPGCMEKLND